MFIKENLFDIKRTAMEKKIISILKKVYFHENGYYNSKFDRHEHKLPSSISVDDIQLLKQEGLEPNNFETFSHDMAIKRFLNLRENKKLTQEFVVSLFYKGITGEFVRWRQSLMSYLYLKHFSEHGFAGKNKQCEICALPENKTEDKTDTLYTYYLGHSWNEFPLHSLIELEECIRFEKPVIGQTEKQCLINLLNFISEADAEETPGKLEKRIHKAKLLPRTDKYMRYGILITLAECGVLPNDLIEPAFDKQVNLKERLEAGKKVKGSPRSDIVLPLAGWRGKLGVNFERAKDIFGI